MKKVENITITRFETECFWIDIIETESEFEAWLQEKHNGVSSLMFGFPKHQVVNGEALDVDYDFFCDMVETNMDDYVYDYYREYVNGWEDS